MKYRKLGKTKLGVSEIGFGAWGIGGDSYGPVDDEISKDALRRAYDLGVTFFDTADCYGGGHSEELVGQTLKNVRQNIVLATKGGTLPHFGFKMPQDFSPQHLREALEASLKRMQTDYIDLYQLHSPPSELLHEREQIQDSLETLEKMQQEGKIIEYGISTRTPTDGLFAVQELSVNIIQVNFNLIDQRAIEIGLLDYCLNNQKSVIARTPFAFGFLTGRYNPGVKFIAPDHRSNWPQEQIDCWANAPSAFSSLNTGKNRTLAQLALLFCLSHSAISTTIPGVMNRKELEENLQIMALPPLKADEIMKIREIYNRNTFYVGRTAPESQE